MESYRVVLNYFYFQPTIDTYPITILVVSSSFFRSKTISVLEHKQHLSIAYLGLLVPTMLRLVILIRFEKNRNLDLYIPK